MQGVGVAGLSKQASRRPPTRCRGVGCRVWNFEDARMAAQWTDPCTPTRTTAKNMQPHALAHAPHATQHAPRSFFCNWAMRVT